MNFTYMKTPLYRLTFKNKRIREWVEEHCEGNVLNLFAGKNRLNCREIRNDLREDMDADYHMDALDFLQWWVEHKPEIKFGTILLDPPYSFRKSMEMYDGVRSSRFNQVKNHIPKVLHRRGIVICFGYHSVNMGNTRGFKQEHLLVMSHSGAIHDTLCIIEREDNGLTREEVSAFFPSH